MAAILDIYFIHEVVYLGAHLMVFKSSLLLDILTVHRMRYVINL